MRERAQRVSCIRRELIVSADDFGLSREVNEAVVCAHERGILRAASLMVAAPQAADAVERARRLRSLCVGLHLVLVNGRPMLPARSVPDLVDGQGHFLTHLGRAGVRFFFRRGIRRQLESEIRAQFEAFAATGLSLDHVNAQNHMHLHPTILGLVIKVGRDYGMRAVRVPREPFLASWRATRTTFAARLANAVFLAPWLGLMRQRLKHAGLVTNDFVFGMNDSGQMVTERVLALLNHLPSGVSEMYFHPATGPWRGIDSAIADYAFAAELEALTSPRTAASLRTLSIIPATFGEIAARRAQ